MFSVKLLISRIHKIHFRSLQVVPNTYYTTYDGLLSVNSDVLIYQRRLYFLVTEAFKLVNNLNPHFTSDYFKMNFVPYDSRKGNTLPQAH